MKDKQFEESSKEFLNEKKRKKASKKAGWCLYGKGGCNDPVRELCMCNMQNI